MRKLLLLIAVIHLTVDASAIIPIAPQSLTCTAGTQNVDFVPLAEVAESAALAAAAVKLEFPFTLSNGEEGTGRCSGSVVSDEGHILTASHCLEECERRAKLNPVRTSNLKCEAKINGQLVSVEVMIMAKCTIKEIAELEVQISKGEAVRGNLLHCRNQGDIAILKPQRKLGDFGCLKMANTEAQVGERVRAFGYPRNSERPAPGRNSDGKTLVITEGKVVESGTCLQRVPSSAWARILGLRSPESLVEVPLGDGAFLNRRFIQASSDSLHGLSGGPLINSNAEVLGVSSFLMDGNHGVHAECKGATFVERLRFLQSMAEDWGVTRELNQMKCDKKRIRSQARQL